jgi:DNA polymerase I
MNLLNPFREIWLVDFEFTAPDGCNPRPLCLVAREVGSGRLIRSWLDGEASLIPPYPTGPDVLFVAYYASAEVGCHLALGWPVPQRILDLCAEFRCLTSDLVVLYGKGLLGALSFFGLDGIAAAEKEGMRQLAMRGGPYSAEERLALLEYCESDVDALARLLPAMLPHLDLPRSLLRGRYMAAAARIERAGVPIDTDTLARLRADWDGMKSALIERVDVSYGVYEDGSFREARFEAYLARTGIPWPRLSSGRLDLGDGTFRQIARAHSAVAPLRELRHSLGQLRLNDLVVGPDGRNRAMLSAFASKTGRNQPSNSRFIFGPARWLRGLILPAPGMAVAYVDYEQQEFGIAAALSRDPAMMAAYRSGDPYLAIAKQAGAVPPDATKKTHSHVRNQFKQCVLAVQYGQGPEGLAQRLGVPVARARELLEMHRRAYPLYWAWSDAVEMHAMLYGSLHTTFGWLIHVGPNANPRSLRNFPMQANGAEMLRLACCLATERGIVVCAPIHDALLVEAPIDQIEEVVARTQQAMEDASELVLDGFRLRSAATIVRYPDRYMDEAGKAMWDMVMSLLP